MKTIKIPLYSVQVGDQFVHENRMYTVSEQAEGMTEVISKGKFWAWPHYNGAAMIKVNQIISI